jgi:hypothetical protein
MSRCVGRDPASVTQRDPVAAPGNAHCTACATRTFRERFAFEGWMQRVVIAMEAECGLHPDDLPDCTYADWYESGMTPEEAARQVLALFMDA